MRRKILSNSKKGSLSLSMNAIVVVVLAFAMLGLGLTVTNMIFKSIKIPEIPDAIGEPTAEMPILIPDTIKVKRGGQVTLPLSFYNADDSTNWDALPNVTNCIDDTASQMTELPIYAVLSADVESGEDYTYKGTFSLKDKTTYKGGQTYVCTIEIGDSTKTACDPSEATGDLCDEASEKNNGVYEQVGFFLTITT